MIKVENLRFAYGSKTVLAGMDFTLPPESLTVVCGNNGCGKSTLLKIICRILKADEGEISLLGRDINDFSRRELAQHVAYMGQNPPGGGNFTAAELAAMGRYAHGGGRADGEIIDEALEIAGAAAFRDRRISDLSGGERQRAFLAMALAQTPEILLLDEPFSALDPAGVRELMGKLQALKKRKKMSIVMVLHDINFALHGADMILGMRDGETLFCAPPSEAAEKLPELFALPPEVLQRTADGKFNFLPY